MIKYVIVTPVRNEELFIEKTIVSIINQNVIPQQWVIVNDGSTDATKSIIDKYLSENPWIKKIDLPNYGDRPGEGPARAFNEGYKSITSEYDYIINLDGDISIQSDFFEEIFKKFELNSELGIASGKAYYKIHNKLVLCRSRDITTTGPCKVYRKKCFEDLGSVLVNHMCWDMYDDLKASMLGWETRSFSDLKFIHLKVQGARQSNVFRTYFKHGRLLYTFGYDPLYMGLKSIYRGFEKPYFILTLSIPMGYIYAAIKKESFITDQDMRDFLRKRQIKFLKRLVTFKKHKNRILNHSK